MMPQSLGAHSPKLDDVRALRLKAGRREQQRFLAEGPTMLAEALEAGVVPEAVYLSERSYGELGPFAESLQDRLYLIPERALARLSDLDTPPGLVAVFPWALQSLGEALETRCPALVLAGVNDPGNAGTLLRSAEIFGVTTAIFIHGSVEPYHPKVVRATMGAIFRVRLLATTGGELADAAREQGYGLVAATRDGVPLPEFCFPKRVLLAVGNERHGVAQALPRWDVGVTIPQRGSGESLNAAVAGSIILYAFSQQASAMIAES